MKGLAKGIPFIHKNEDRQGFSLTRSIIEAL